MGVLMGGAQSQIPYHTINFFRSVIITFMDAELFKSVYQGLWDMQNFPYSIKSQSTASARLSAYAN